ncbi:MAG: phosphate ABC transporter permease subunit PstC [Caldilineales bacterium]
MEQQSVISSAAGAWSDPTQPIDLHKRRRLGESIIRVSLIAAAFVSVATTIGIVLVLIFDAIKFLIRPEVSLWEFFTSTIWQPQILQFGIFPLFNATVLTSLIGMSVALPIGLMIAIYLSEYASARARGILKPTLEILAGIPTVVFGFFALGFVTPLLQGIFGKNNVEIFNVASAGLVIGILIIPLVSSMSEDALSAVPRSLREASYGIGATRLETAVRVVLPAALSGISAAVIVGISRAVGETMVVAIAAGAGPRNFANWPEALKGLNFLNPFKAAETMTGHIVRISGGDISYDSIDYDSIFAIAFMLFILTLILNIISRWVVRRFRQEY